MPREVGPASGDPWLSNMRNPDTKSRRRGRVSWGEVRYSQQLGWGRPGRTAGVLPLLQGGPGQWWAILVLLLLGLSLAGLTDHTFPQTLQSLDGPALDLGAFCGVCMALVAGHLAWEERGAPGQGGAGRG